MESKKNYSAILSNRLGHNCFICELHKEDYENYLPLYIKEKNSGNVEIETSNQFASYYITNTYGDLISCKAIAPYTHLELNIATNETLFLYPSESIKIKKKIYDLNDFSREYKNLSIFLVFVLPFLIVCLLEVFLIKDYKISFVLYFAYFILILVLSHKKNRHTNKLEEKRKKFLEAYYNGKDDCK